MSYKITPDGGSLVYTYEFQGKKSFETRTILTTVEDCLVSERGRLSARVAEYEQQIADGVVNRRGQQPDYFLGQTRAMLAAIEN